MVSPCMHAAVIHPFAEELVYFVLLGIPLFTMIGTGTASVVHCCMIGH